MTYIQWYLAFELWCKTNYLPMSAELLWYKLVNLFNMGRWPEWVSVDNQTLMGMIRIADRRTLTAARNALIEAGLLEYQKGKRGTMGRYRLLEEPFLPYQKKNPVPDSGTEVPIEEKPEPIQLQIHPLTEEEYQRLVHTYGERLVKDKIRKASGYQNCDNYETIREWCEQEKGKQNTGNRFHNFQQRDYDYAALEKILSEK